MAKTKNKHRRGPSRPSGMTLADELVRRQMIKKAVKEAAVDATVQVRSDMLWLKGSAGENTETTVATLPEGFRPTALFRATGITDTGSIQSQHQCGIAVNESGLITIQSRYGWGYVSGIFTFRAAN